MLRSLPSHAAGELDPSFGTLGIVRPVAGEAMVVQPDDQIVTVGHIDNPDGTTSLTVTRFTTAGTLDPSFGINGTTALDLGMVGGRATRGTLTTVSVDAQGRIVAAGDAEDVAGHRIVTVRLLSDGTPDSTFYGGLAFDNFSPTGESALGVIPLSDGKVLVLYRHQPSATPLACLRLQANGTNDLTFGPGGVMPVSSFPGVAGVLRPDADHVLMVVTDFDQMTSASTTSVLRLTLPDFRPDPSFGPNGDGILPIAGVEQLETLGAALQTDGRLVLVGDQGSAAFVARVDVDGLLDHGFGANGITAVAVTGGTSQLGSVAIDSHGRIVVAGFRTSQVPHFDALVGRLQPDGTRDASFGSAGFSLLRVTSSDADDELARTVALLEGDAPVILGNLHLDLGGAGFFALKLLPNDPTRCGDGVVEGTESCDDGNQASGDCCSPTCTPEPAGSPCESGSLCAPGRCDGAGRCEERPTPASACHPIASPRKSVLAMKDSSSDTSDALGWRWSGAPFAPGDLGAAIATTSYAFCLYDESQTAPALLSEVTVPAGGTCGKRPCWTSKGPGLAVRYRNPALKPDGIRSLLLDPSRGTLTLVGSGEPLTLPTLPLPLPARVQLRASTGACWESRHSASGATHDDRGRFNGYAD